MRAKWYFLGCLSSVLLLILFIVLSVNSLMKMSKKTTTTKIEDNSVLYLNLTGQLQDYSGLSDTNFKFISDTAHDIIQKINSAKDDARIRSIVLEPNFLVCGYATANEIMSALETFKTSGKKIYGYINFASQKDILLLSVADEVYMNPSASAGFMMNGVGGNIAYYKDMFDKLGITVHIVRAGEYKAAGENYSRRTMSPEFRRNITELYDDIYGQLVGDLASNYNTTKEDIRYIFEKREKYFINLEESKQVKIVDELMHFDRFLKKINVSDKQLVRYSKYKAEDIKQLTNRIAVVYALGPITGSKAQFGENNISAKQFVKIFDKIEKDDNIRAVVIRVNSPGGSALESEIIYNRIEQLKQKKPVVISMGDVAASGGYYIAANSNYIFADPYTITGSIGVIGMIPDLNKASDKIGINTETVGHGKFISSFDIWKGYNREFESALQKGINDTYHEFKTRVSEGRNIDYYQLEKFAQGMVWSAPKALEYKLIDEIGLLQDAVNKAARLAFADNYSIKYYPERQSLFDFILEDNFNFSLTKYIFQNQLPKSISNPANNFLNLFEEIKTNPVQLRPEVYIESL